MSSLITLRSQDGAYEVKIQPTRGANCLRFEHVPSKISALRTYDPDEITELDNAFLYGTPLLFPQCGKDHPIGRKAAHTPCFLSSLTEE